MLSQKLDLCRERANIYLPIHVCILWLFSGCYLNFSTTKHLPSYTVASQRGVWLFSRLFKPATSNQLHSSDKATIFSNSSSVTGCTDNLVLFTNTISFNSGTVLINDNGMGFFSFFKGLNLTDAHLPV